MLVTLGLALACEREPEKPAPSSPPAATGLAAQLETCAAGFEAIEDTPIDERASELIAWLPTGRPCFELLFAGCADLGVPESLEDFGTLTAACVERRCPQLEPRPGLCDAPDASAFVGGEEAVYDHVVEFLAAKLAADLDRPRTDPSIQRFARAYAPLWASPIMAGRVVVSPPSFAPAAGPGEFSVRLEMDGRIVLERALSPGADSERTTLAPKPDGAFDFAALAEYTRAQVEVLPPASTTVSVTTACTVPMQDLVTTLDTLRGTECESPSGSCLYTQVEVVANDPESETEPEPD